MIVHFGLISSLYELNLESFGIDGLCLNEAILLNSLHRKNEKYLYP